MKPMQRILKEIFDRVAALLLLALATPIVAVAALLIKLSSRGPVFYTQERVGFGERPFQIFKFRTMHVAADRHALGNVTIKDDPRVFFVGQWLRKLKVDEVPQIVNVLIGNMSLVGPRPTVIDDYRRMTREQRRRATVKPGITGLAQINGAASINWPRRIEFDLDYIDNFSLRRDFAILVRTALLVVTGRADANPIEGDEWAETSENQILNAAKYATPNSDSQLAIDGGTPVRSTPFPRWPEFDEEMIDVATAVLRSGKVNYWTGDQTRTFEREFADFVGAQHAVAVANGTLALELALEALGVGDGDEVIVPCRTFVASASAVMARGATPVFADVDATSQNITAETIEAALSQKTKAAIAVHLAGWPCDMASIMSLAERHGLVVLEDCAQAHGAKYNDRPVGSIGDAAAFSFCQDKIMTTGGEGGMLTTNDKDVWRRAWSFKDHGKSWDAVHDNSQQTIFKWLHESAGSNYRMTEMQSAIGRVMLQRLPGWLAARRRNAAMLSQRLAHVSALSIPKPPHGVEHSYYKFYAFLDLGALREDWSRDDVVRALQAEGIPCGSGACGEIYREKVFVDTDLAPIERLPVARELGETSLMYQVHPTMTERDLDDICRGVEKVLRAAVLSHPKTWARAA
jgi:hypothetical protein